MTQQSENCLILGLAAGYHAGDVRPFLVSLARSGFQGECALFVSSTTRDVGRMAELGPKRTRVASFERPAEHAHAPYNAWRYFLYLDFLRSSAARFDRVLITDVRDVVFQRDPFDFPWPVGVSVALEHDSSRVGACEWMERWTLGHLGEAAYEAMRGRRISCSGTTVADHDAMLDYLEKLTARLLPFIPGNRMAGYDQAVHNLMLHEGVLPQVAAFDNEGPILTLGSTPDAPELSESGDVLNDAGEPAIIVHQYDRKRELFKQVRARWA